MPEISVENNASQERKFADTPLAKVVNFFLVVIIAVALSFLIRNYILTPYEIPSGSMLDTIQLQDRVMSERISYYIGEPQQGDIITFTDPSEPSRTLIKRIIAIEGQTVDLRDGMVYVDGKPLNEPYTDGKASYPLDAVEGITPEEAISFPYTVPKGYVWVMGDNRTESADSRVFGAVPTDTISGKALFRYWPLDRIGAIE